MVPFLLWIQKHCNGACVAQLLVEEFYVLVYQHLFGNNDNQNDGLFCFIFKCYVFDMIVCKYTHPK